MPGPWIKRFDSRHSLLNVFALISSFPGTTLGTQNRNIIITSNEGRVSFFRKANENKALRPIWLKELLDRSRMRKNIMFSNIAVSNMNAFATRVQNICSTVLTNAQLNKLYQRYCSLFHTIFIAYMMSQPEVPEACEEYLLKRLTSLVGNRKKSLMLFQKLTLPSELTLLDREERDWLKLELRHLNNHRKVDRDIMSLLSHHSKMYGWISTQENLPYHDERYFKRLLIQQASRKTSSDIRRSIAKITTRAATIKKERRHSLALIHNDAIVRETTTSMRELGLLRINLRLAWTKGAYYVQPFLKEIGSRLGIDTQDVVYLLPNEVHDALNGTTQRIPEIKQRQRGYLAMIANGAFKLLLGNDAQRMIRREKLTSKAVSRDTITGMPATPGIVRGRVKIIHSHQTSQADEVKKMRRGDILVAGSTKPQLIEACRKASAIVTDEGGMLSHAAIISRELGIPCVVGTKIGTSVFKDGDYIEVDANAGNIKKLR